MAVTNMAKITRAPLKKQVRDVTRLRNVQEMWGALRSWLDLLTTRSQS